MGRKLRGKKSKRKSRRKTRRKRKSISRKKKRMKKSKRKSRRKSKGKSRRKRKSKSKGKKMVKKSKRKSSTKSSSKTLYKLYRSSGPKKFDVYLPHKGRVKKVSFGAKGYSDYTIHKDKERRARYRSRHRGDKLKNPYSSGFWAWYALWGDSSNLKTAFASAVRKAKKLVKK